jgi:hypothetical protein
MERVFTEVPDAHSLSSLRLYLLLLLYVPLGGFRRRYYLTCLRCVDQFHEAGHPIHQHAG